MKTNMKTAEELLAKEVEVLTGTPVSTSIKNIEGNLMETLECLRQHSNERVGYENDSLERIGDILAPIRRDNPAYQILFDKYLEIK